MYKMRNLFLFIIYIINFVNIYCLADNKEISICLESREYRNIYIAAYPFVAMSYGTDSYMKQVLFEGQLLNDSVWSFSIPDTLYHTIGYFELLVEPYTSNLKYVHNIRFEYNHQEEVLTTNYLNFESLASIKHLKYKNTEYSNDNTIEFNGEWLENVSYKTDAFDVSLTNPQSELYIIAKYPRFGLLSTNQKQNELLIQEFLSITKSFPNSKYLLFRLCYSMNSFENKDDLKLIFDNFSENNKNSYFGNIIKEYLTFNSESFPFTNDSLLNSQTNEKEHIIKDFSKYNLVVFSASWCGPCHKAIPTLKEIKQTLGNKVEITYISIDEKNSIRAWNELIKNQNITWRSLLLQDDINQIRKKYFIEGVPTYILVNHQGVASKLSKKDVELIREMIK